MYNVSVQLTKTDTALPANTVFAGTDLTVTDAAGVVQKFVLTGKEAPAWSQLVNGLADGPSNYVAQDVDVNGAAIGAPITNSFTPKAVTFPATSALNVTQV